MTASEKRGDAVVGRGRRAAPGVVHRDVEATVVGHDAGHQRIDLLGLAHVARPELVGPARRLVAPAHHDGGAGLREAVGDGRPDALRAAGDEGDPAAEVDADRHEGSVYQTELGS